MSRKDPVLATTYFRVMRDRFGKLKIDEHTEPFKPMRHALGYTLIKDFQVKELNNYDT